MEITEAIAIRVRDTIDAGLVSGLGRPKPGQMCVEAAVCYAMGLPHSDEPSCVSPALRRLKVRLNDSLWSSPQARARGLRRLGLAQLGSAGVLDDARFSRRVAEMTIRTVVPAALRAAARRVPSHAESLLTAAKRCEVEGGQASAAAYAAAAAAATYSAVAYAAAAYAAASDAVAYAADAAADAAIDRALSDFAEAVVQILIEMDAPGCRWLYLTEPA